MVAVAGDNEICNFGITMILAPYCCYCLCFPVSEIALLSFIVKLHCRRATVDE